MSFSIRVHASAGGSASDYLEQMKERRFYDYNTINDYVDPDLCTNGKYAPLFLVQLNHHGAQPPWPQP